MPKVSVILTCYNHEKYLREAIDSTLNQTYDDFELIIWDDASTDESWSIINSYKDSRIRAFRNKKRKRGVYGINKAIQEIANGVYIAIHHSDDVWDSKKLERQVQFLDNHPNIGAVFTNALAIDENGVALEDKTHFYYKVFDQSNKTRYEWLKYFFYKGNVLCHPSVLIRRHCYEECGLYRPWLAQTADFDMWIRLCFKYNIYVLPERLVYFRVRAKEANTSGNRPDANIRGRTEFHYLLKNYLLINTFDLMVSIFPEVQKFYRKGGFDNKFVFSMVCLRNESLHWAKLFGLELLFDLLENKSKKIKDLYGFDYLNFIEHTGIYDIFSLEELSNLHVEAQKQVSALTERANIAETYAKSLNQELIHAREIYSEVSKTRTTESTEAQKQIDALTTRVNNVETYAKSLNKELIHAMEMYNEVSKTRTIESMEAQKQINALTTRVNNAETYAKSLIKDYDRLRKAYDADCSSWLTEKTKMQKEIDSQIQELKKYKSHWMFKFFFRP